MWCPNVFRNICKSYESFFYPQCLNSTKKDNLRGYTTVEFSKNHFFFYWLKRCYEPSKIWGKQSNPWKKIVIWNFKSRIFSFFHVYNTFQNFKRVFLEIWFFKTVRSITQTIFNIFNRVFSYIFIIAFQRETRRRFSIN